MSGTSLSHKIVAAESKSSKMRGYKKTTMLSKLSTSPPLITKLTAQGVLELAADETQNTTISQHGVGPKHMFWA